MSESIKESTVSDSIDKQATNTTKSKNDAQSDDSELMRAREDSKHEKITLDEVIEMRQQVEILIDAVNKRKRKCKEIENEGKYLQDYIGSLVQSDTLKR
ncbi:hypothetical protein BRETT_005288 [Brettanomyces bruxellensis]|uniref:Uncharacterized protein n=1 Tax=Dekkera bruxellensis TaxID=5007 RepID=A0A871R069_DEKBR|nr:uncharacterized protein BRETT_005288 [Brettanomyces bruxellensis]QOU18226.1 hypothetical protein BRETT_005288 [Brettanomyces bruxellensis]